MLSKGQFFVAWVVVALIWLWATLFIGNFYPLYDGGLRQIWTVVRRLTRKDMSVEVPSEESSEAAPEHPSK